MLARAANDIAKLRELGSQGIIIWDLEGYEFQDMTYIGNPTILSQIAPETDDWADGGAAG